MYQIAFAQTKAMETIFNKHEKINGRVQNKETLNVTITINENCWFYEVSEVSETVKHF